MPTASLRGGPAGARAGGKTPGVGKGGGKMAGKLAGKTILHNNRRRKILKDSIQGITRPAIRRLARRGGVKRISHPIYDEARAALRARLETILQACALYVEYRNAKTVTIKDVLFSLRKLGRPIYGFDPETYDARKKTRAD